MADGFDWRLFFGSAQFVDWRIRETPSCGDLARLADLPSLRRLELEGEVWPCEGFPRIAGLERLDLYFEEFPDEAWAGIAELSNLRSLEVAMPGSNWSNLARLDGRPIEELIVHRMANPQRAAVGLRKIRGLQTLCAYHVALATEDIAEVCRANPSLRDAWFCDETWQRASFDELGPRFPSITFRRSGLPDD